MASFGASFPAKRAVLGRSAIPLTAEAARAEQWNTAAISARSASLAAAFMTTWPRRGPIVIEGRADGNADVDLEISDSTGNVLYTDSNTVVQALDDEGNPVFDDDKNPVYEFEPARYEGQVLRGDEFVIKATVNANSDDPVPYAGTNALG